MNPSARPFIGIIVAICIVVAIIHAFGVAAAPPPNPDPALREWFNSLRQPGTNSSCCDLSDCRAVASRTGEEGYEVLLTPVAFPVAEERWVKVPAQTILQGKDNPLGRAVVCWTPSRGVLCFVKPAEA